MWSVGVVCRGGYPCARWCGDRSEGGDGEEGEGEGEEDLETVVERIIRNVC